MLITCFKGVGRRARYVCGESDCREANSCLVDCGCRGRKNLTCKIGFITGVLLATKSSRIIFKVQFSVRLNNLLAAAATACSSSVFGGSMISRRVHVLMVCWRLCFL